MTLYSPKSRLSLHARPLRGFGLDSVSAQGSICICAGLQVWRAQASRITDRFARKRRRFGDKTPLSRNWPFYDFEEYERLLEVAKQAFVAARSSVSSGATWIW